ncbi:hypothetical protein EVAR_52145_1 [Eumeta japonica]|uniref:Uncharacterized protein n=1 Tax=Eumeta variegata TaxID=151549 RepID=A0A4C2A895_EUMVA|nr:hypothetical protein EVAR_52145_1 [Eumeta japonica]
MRALKVIRVTVIELPYRIPQTDPKFVNKRYGLANQGHQSRVKDQLLGRSRLRAVWDHNLNLKFVKQFSETIRSDSAPDTTRATVSE